MRTPKCADPSCACHPGPKPTKWRWLESTKRLQEEAYGKSYDQIPTAETAAELKDQLLAALVELAGEVPREFHWKPWSHDKPWINRDALLEEIVDVQHFLGNALVLLGVTDAEYEEAYQSKQQKNRDRQTDGYRVQREYDEIERALS